MHFVLMFNIRDYLTVTAILNKDFQEFYFWHTEIKYGSNQQLIWDNCNILTVECY